MKIEGCFARAACVALPLLLGVAATASAANHVSVSVVNGEIVLSPDPLPVGAGHDVPLTWEVTTAGWRFEEHGISIEDNDGEFSDAHLSADGRTFHEIDKDDNASAYKYTVSLTDGTHSLSEDPTIQNGGH